MIWHSISGNLFVMAGANMSWMSKKQVTVSLSAAEAEYIALSTVTQESMRTTLLLLQ